MKNRSLPPSRLLLPLMCLLLSSCKETLQMKSELNELNAKIQSVQTEMSQIDAQMMSLRSQLPPTVATEQAAKQLVVQLAAGVVAIENEIAQTQASIKEAEVALEAARKDTEALRNKDPR